MTSPIRTETLRGGAVERVVLARPNGNVLDGEMVTALIAHTRSLERRADLKLVVVEGEGAHFSYGASVEEHLPAGVSAMLGGLHDFFRRRERIGVPTAAIVRGRCLGGGLELALSSGWIFAAHDATLGCPEVKLGVFAPLASLLLPWRTGGSAATDLLVTGKLVDAATAKTLGVVDDVSADPEAALWRWYDQYLAASSAVAVRHAWRAVRRPIHRMLSQDLPELEAMYLGSLMSHDDPEEGLRAFLEHRSPAWRHA